MPETAYACPHCQREYSLAEAREIDFVCPDGEVPLRRLKDGSVDLGSPAMKGGAKMAGLFDGSRESHRIAAAAVATPERQPAADSSENLPPLREHAAQESDDPVPAPPRLEARQMVAPREARKKKPAREAGAPRWIVPALCAAVGALLVLQVYSLSRLRSLDTLDRRVAALDKARRAADGRAIAQQKEIVALQAALKEAGERLDRSMTPKQFDARYRSIVPEMAQRSSKAVVHIINQHWVTVKGRRIRRGGVGSGFIIEDKRYVVTNYHVTHGANTVQCVLYNNYRVQATVHGADPVSDISLLRINLDGVPGAKDIEAPKFASQLPLPGEPAVIIGSPRGLARSVTCGIVSNTRRHTYRQPIPRAWIAAGTFNNWIQTDTAINPGNSGGPMFNLDGEVIGVVTRKLAQVGIDNVGFAIPIGYVEGVVEQLKRRKVRRSTIGVFLRPYNPLVAKLHGVRILDVVPKSPADLAGLQRGDIVTHLNGKKLVAPFNEDLPSIERLLAKLPVNAPATLVIKRNLKTDTIKVTPRVRTALDDKVQQFVQFGFFGSEVTPQVAMEQGLRVQSGVWICGIQLGSYFANTGFKKGDVLQTIHHAQLTGNQTSLRTMELAWNNILNALRRKLTPLKITFRRGNQTQHITLPINYGQ